jgi:hypothetical protein
MHLFGDEFSFLFGFLDNSFKRLECKDKPNCADAEHDINSDVPKRAKLQ